MARNSVTFGEAGANPELIVQPETIVQIVQKDILSWLFARQRFGAKLDLGRTRTLLSGLGHPESSFRAVLIGGTNGKGSVAAALAAMLEAHGERTGLFTSPHLSRFSERFVVAGAELQQAEVLKAVKTLRPAALRANATFFEIVTAAACLLFAEARVTIGVMEVGLGGRLDATNALEPELSVITGVALDHTEYLGPTVAHIAREKAGILREGKLCVTGATGRALEVLEEQALAKGAKLAVLAERPCPDEGLGRKVAESRDDAKGGEGEIGANDLSANGLHCLDGFQDRQLEGVAFTLQGGWGALRLETPLIGPHQARNVALAAMAARELGATAHAITVGAQQAHWPGRLEALPYRGRTILLDGAHNEEAAASLRAAAIALGLRGGVLIFGMSRDKDIGQVAAVLSDVPRLVLTTRAVNSPRAASPEELASYWRVDARVTRDPLEALALALRTTEPGETVLVAGSLYLVGELRALITGEAADDFERWQ